MKKLAQYFKAGKGRGLKIVFWSTLILSIIFGGLTFYTGHQFFKHPMITDFVNSVPTFEIKDGKIQNDKIKWVSYMPMTQIPVVINTTLDTLSLPVPDGLYVTRSAMYSVSERGTRVDRSPLLENQEISPKLIYKTLENFAISFGIGIFLFFFIVSWLAYLIAVAFTYLFGWLVRAKLAVHRPWRVAAVTWIIGLILSMVLAMGGHILSTWVVDFITIVINVIILSRLKD